VTTGQPIAEWVKDHCADLSCKYVMWGQRIWEKGVTSASKAWGEWPYQKVRSQSTRIYCFPDVVQCTTIPNCVNGDRGDNTANHWYFLLLPFQMSRWSEKMLTKLAVIGITCT
jgi:hypothetical protein